MPSSHPAALPADRLLADCDVRRKRGRGPGGQRRNKVETGIEIVHRPSNIRATAGERRTQAENKQQALRRLRLRLAIHVRTPTDQLAGIPSPLWQSRCQDGVIRVNSHHEDFPTLLAEALDTIDAAGFDVSTAAGRLGVSMSQLLRFIRIEPEAWQYVNGQRRERGLHPLK